MNPLSSVNPPSTAATSETLAINGGPAACAPMPVRHLFDQREKQAVVGLFDQALAEGSHILGYNGPQEAAYCKAFAAFMGGGYADAVNSGTNAVYVALRALELPAGCEVIVPPITDPGGIMPVALCGCVPVPIDTQSDFYNIDPALIEQRIAPRTKAIVVAHVTGRPANLDAILDLAKRYDLKILEDCAQAHGARYHGRPVGTFGDVAAFSTMFGKHHATGGQGGVVYTRDEATYQRIRRYADRGKPFGLEAGTTNVAASLNCNLDELHAAIGCVQLTKLPDFIQRIRAFAHRLRDRLADSQVFTFVDDPPHAEGVFWHVPLRVDYDRLTIDKTKLLEVLTAEGVEPFPHYFCSPVATSWFTQRCVFPGTTFPWNDDDARIDDLPRARQVDAELILLKIHEGFEDAHADQIATAFVKAEQAYRK